METEEKRVRLMDVSLMVIRHRILMLCVLAASVAAWAAVQYLAPAMGWPVVKNTLTVQAPIKIVPLSGAASAYLPVTVSNLAQSRLKDRAFLFESVAKSLPSRIRATPKLVLEDLLHLDKAALALPVDQAERLRVTLDTKILTEKEALHVVEALILDLRNAVASEAMPLYEATVARMKAVGSGPGELAAVQQAQAQLYALEIQQVLRDPEFPLVQESAGVVVSDPPLSSGIVLALFVFVALVVGLLLSALLDYGTRVRNDEGMKESFRRAWKRT